MHRQDIEARFRLAADGTEIVPVGAEDRGPIGFVVERHGDVSHFIWASVEMPSSPISSGVSWGGPSRGGPSM